MKCFCKKASAQQVTIEVVLNASDIKAIYQREGDSAYHLESDIAHKVIKAVVASQDIPERRLWERATRVVDPAVAKKSKDAKNG